MSFNKVLEKYRKISFSEHDKGDRFERLMQAYIQTDPKYATQFKRVWLWSEFPGKADLGGGDTGIDLVALTYAGDYWAIQCKCYQESAIIDKPAVDSFLSTSSRKFKGENLRTVGFGHRLWISTTNHWGPNANEAIRNQHPPVSRIHLAELQEAPVDWARLEQGVHGELSRLTGHNLRGHQKEALEKTQLHFTTESRGKLIMACGTGKTFTALRIAESETNGKGLILFLVPSIALIGQTLREWSANAVEPINAVCICSDPEITKKKTQNDDSDGYSTIDLALPASTNVQEILHQFQNIRSSGNKGLTVVFSTYQSIGVISKAQKELSKTETLFQEFDLIICDEAHRTTGVALAGEDESAFTKVHDDNFLKSKKRLYMTATPRLYSVDTKSKAAQAEAVLCSMDDVKLYGEEIYRIGFGEAVERDLLTDYKVLILTLNENDVPPAVQNMLSGDKNEINTDDLSKLIGCINALSKQILGDAGIIKDTDPNPMRRAVAFCQSIIGSKKITETFNTVTDAYISALPVNKKEQMVSVASQHIDGTMSAPARDNLLSWLKADIEKDECRILTNVRCLSEGVDVPSLDAVMFLSARNSEVDVVQSVGRVMRRSPLTNKKYGYIIIPVVVPSDIEPDKALNDNERYKVVWTVLNALRAHDDRFNATINKLELNKNRPEQILVGRPEYSFDEEGQFLVAEPEGQYDTKRKLSDQLAIQFEQLQNVVFARMVQKVGDRRYWEQWAKNVADIAERQVKRITKLINEDVIHQKAFSDFLSGLQKNINPSISQSEAVEMLSQHIITKPVFEALFEGYSFVKNNPISVSMQTMLDLLEDKIVEKDTETLQKFYDSVKMRASGIDNAEGKQRIIIELYDKFFKSAFPKMVEKLGIVYTPVEIVDFIINSVNDVLKKEFRRSIGDKNIHILDPFTGTGTFITRLLQSGLINKNDLERKYTSEIFANEIVLLAYYIAAVNIENAYHDSMADAEYKAFEGICLTDTFQLGEVDANYKLYKDMFPQNSERVIKQKNAPLRVIMGNPPYSVGQKSANDNAQNQKYDKLDARISKTYAAETDATNKNSLYDSYFKAFRWSTDRLDPDEGGIICFVSNGGWIDGNSSDGFRRSLEKEFSSIYVFNLRGDARTQGELRRKEAGNVFGGGSRTPITITLLVKKPSDNLVARIYYHDIGDYLDREEKLNLVRKYHSVQSPKIRWQLLAPNKVGDWIGQRDELFNQYIPIGAEKKFDNKSSSFFIVNSRGNETARDVWVYNSSKTTIISNMQSMVAFYNEQLEDFLIAKRTNPKIKINDFINNDASKISWSSSLISNLERGMRANFQGESFSQSLYRPFFKQILYLGDKMIHRRGQMDLFFPANENVNRVICVSGVGVNKDFSAIICNTIPDLELIGKSQCFPLYYFEKNGKLSMGLFDIGDSFEYTRKDGVSDFILENAKKIYGKTVGKEDVFYYVYGILHSPNYREQFAHDLKKMLPRLPLIDDVRQFWKFSKAGRELAEIHINYETVNAYNWVTVIGAEHEHYRVEKMRYPKKDQKDTIIFNSKITISNIPAKAYEYVVNGKSAIDWIIERYQITIDRESGIKNDPNDWAHAVGNPRYILDLLLSIINVSVQTVDIVNSLPKLSFDLDEKLIDTENNIHTLDNIFLNHELPEIAAMKEFSLNEGIYFIDDVVQMTRLNRDKVTRWFKELSKENYEGLSDSQQQDASKMRISFYGLIELVVIGTLRDNGFKLKKILTARTNLKNITKKIYPFATNNVRDDLKVAGNSIEFTIGSDVVTLDGTSQLNLEIIRSFFNNIEFDTEGLAQQLFPVKDSKLIVIDPKQGGGKAVINNGSGVWAETIAALYDGPASINMLTTQFEANKEEILASVEYLKASVEYLN